MMWFRPLSFLGALTLTLVTAPSVVVAQPICCYNCGSGGPARITAVPARERSSGALDHVMAIHQRHTVRQARAGQGGAGSRFLGQIDGDWDDVDGYFTFPYQVTGLGEMNVLLRGFPAQSMADGVYSVSGWDGRVYWLDVGDGKPRLLQALELASDYVPAVDDYFFGSQDVRDTCVMGAGCTLNLVPYLRYREFGVDYAGTDRGFFEEGEYFDEVQMAFVTDGNGDAIDAAVLFDDAVGTDPIQPFSVNDDIQLTILAYKLDEPEFIYALGYMDGFATLTKGASIVRAAFVPGVDFVDPDLPADLDVGNRPIRLILDASREDGAGYGIGGARTGQFAYGGPFDLGFLWRNSEAFVFRNGLEALTSVPPAPAQKLSPRHRLARP